jgi:DNA-binding NtrC family response regulator
MKGTRQLQPILALRAMTDQDDIEASGLRTARCKRIHGEFKPDRLVSERRHFFLVTDQTRLGLEDGLDLLREVRLSSDVPVIIITGHRRDDIDRVVGLELGADDYLTKPFNLRELLARVARSCGRSDARRRRAITE